MTERKAVTMKQKLASALLEMLRLGGTPIDRAHAALMHEDQLISLVQFDHDAGYACHGAGNHFTRLTPKLRPEHIEKTKKDQGVIAKCMRLSEKQEESRRRILAKSGQGEATCQQGEPCKDPSQCPDPKGCGHVPRRKYAWPSRPLNMKGAKLRSRNDLRKRVKG